MIARGLLGSLCVLAGGWVVATLPQSTPMLRHRLLVELRTHEPTRLLALALVVLGLALLAHAWLRLLRTVRCSANRVESLALVRFSTVLWAAPLVLAPPLFSRDGWSYAAQGTLAAAGVSPYQHGPWLLDGPVHQAVDPLWWFTPAPYGPLPLWWGATMAHHSGNPLMLAIGHRVLALIGVALLAWAVPRLARWTGANPAFATAVVIASPAMMASGIGGLHNDILMIGLMAAALVVGIERHWAWGAVLGGLAAAVKVPGGVVCLGIVVATVPIGARLGARALRAAYVAAIALAVLFGVSVLSGLGSGWVHALGVPGTVMSMTTPAVVLGMPVDGLAHLIGWHPGAHFFVELFRHLGTALIAIALVWIGWRWPSGDRASAVRAVALALSVLVLCSPVVQLWYLLWPAPFLAVVPMSRRARTALVSALIVTALIAPLDGSLHRTYKVLAMGLTLAALALGAGLAVRWWVTQRHRPSWFGANQEGL